MPGASRTANYKQETINNKRKTVNFNKLFPVSSFQFPVFNKGFTLIELLVVITLFGIISSLIVASYLTFDNNQKIRSAAQTLKNDLRFAQNKALAGDKGVSNVSGGDCDNTSLCCPNFITPNNYYLVGWYVIFDTTQTSTYTYAGVCKSASGAESTFNSKTVNFPPGVVLHSVEIGGNPLSGTVVKVLLKPLTTSVSLHSNSAPPFLNASGNLMNVAPQAGNLVIKLKDQQSASAKYQITVQTSGEISEKKIQP